MTLRFVLALHSHLPWVLHHGRWPHGSDWICEATLDSYLPLVDLLDQLETEAVPPAFTLGITPILAAQFADPALRGEVDHYFAHRLATIDEAPDSLRATGDAHLLPLVDFWREHVLALQRTWQGIDRDLIGALRRHADAGRIELISSAATHGFLPLLARDESIRFQLLVGRAEHARHFGELPHGCWVPECAYRPAGPWQPSPDAPYAPMRTGLEDHLRYAGFRWFFVDSHMIDAGEAWDAYGGAVRLLPRDAGTRSPHRAYQVGLERRGRPIWILARDPVATAQVWSRAGGYPGDSRYLEFHKIRFPGGLKFWAVTDPAADLGLKAPYRPAAGDAAVSEHAAHFRALLDARAAGAGPDEYVIATPFDTELFGHWWFEGVEFLRYLYEDLASPGLVHAATAGQAIAEAPDRIALRLGAGSWGKDGDFSMWLNPATDWTWRRLWPLEARFWDAVPAALQRWNARFVLEQAARELLLAQGSDWQFIISTGAAGDYATRRFDGHCDALEALLPFIENPSLDLATGNARAAALAAVDGPFSDLLGALAAASDVPRA